MANILKRADTGTWINVQRRTTTYTRSTHGKGPVEARVSTSRGVQSRTQDQQTEKGRYRHVDPCPEAYSHVHRANTPKRGRYRHVDPRPKAFSHVHKANTPKIACKGTWIHLKRRTCGHSSILTRTPPSGVAGSRRDPPLRIPGNRISALKSC